MGYGDADSLNLPRVGPEQLTHPFSAAPLGIHKEQCFAVFPAEHAREARCVVIDSLQHFAAFAHPQANRLTS
jgi:hypothetical protein